MNFLAFWKNPLFLTKNKQNQDEADTCTYYRDSCKLNTGIRCLPIVEKILSLKFFSDPMAWARKTNKPLK